MIKILQFGEGNFLRTFTDAYFDCLNKEGLGEYSVDIVKPIALGSLEKFAAQNNRYHIILRGVAGGVATEKVYRIDVLDKVIDPFKSFGDYIALAADPQLKIIVSNTTEAGICYSDKDSFDAFDGITYPAKLTKFLYERYKSGLDGVYLLPVELIDSNADRLKECVDAYITLWALPEKFRKWNDTECYYCNTLVDRIVSGYPRDGEGRLHAEKLIGEADSLFSIGEPFGLWAVERKGNIAEYIKEGEHNIEVVLTDDIGYCKKRKVRVLNGSHTNLVPAGLMLGMSTVYDCMTDARLSAFVEDTLKEEVNPFVSDDLAATSAFADSVKARFSNPYLNHQLTSILLNSVSKWRARVLPSFKDYYERHGEIPKRLTAGFSYLLALYSLAEERDGRFYAKLPTREIEITDTKEYLDFFARGGCARDFMTDCSIWGEDLTLYRGFAEAVERNIKDIESGVSII